MERSGFPETLMLDFGKSYLIPEITIGDLDRQDLVELLNTKQ